ncbi:G-protein coupled receptor 78 [Symphalangus syndactylus]|uniref:G-protein coupled receptor 78 n=1 Tax=Symphalangus syndactylus TaxID=9590 RepID=UPI00244282BD|nr:G-protein coupled receptor 78 [Symphalangus syndactylus]
MGPGDALLAGLLVMVLAVALLSNALVLLCCAYSAELRTRASGVLLVNLSLGHLLLAALDMPFTLLGVMRGRTPSAPGACQAIGFLDTFLASNAALSVAALSADQWLAVGFPLRYAGRLRPRYAGLLLGCAWGQSLAFSGAALGCSWLGYSSAFASCSLRLPPEPERPRFAAFTATLHAMGFVLPLAVLCLTSLQVHRVARSHCQRMDTVTMKALVLLADLHPSVRQRCLIQQKRRRHRATRKIGIAIATFLICFAPYVVTRLAELVPFITVNAHWGILSKCLTYSKAAADPFTYSLLRRPFRQVLAGMVHRLLKRTPRPASTHNSSLDVAGMVHQLLKRTPHPASTHNSSLNTENDSRLQQTH